MTFIQATLKNKTIMRINLDHVVSMAANEHELRVVFASGSSTTYRGNDAIEIWNAVTHVCDLPAGVMGD